MYFTDDSIAPKNMEPLIITAAPYGPSWQPGDTEDIAVTWDEQVQVAIDCQKAGATILHIHVRNPATGQLSTNFDDYNYFLGLLKQAVPEMILQVGGSISFAPKEGHEGAEWLDYDTRHMLTELNPKPEFVTVAIGTCMMDLTQMWDLDDVKGTHMEDPNVLAKWAGMYTDAGPAFYLEHLKRLKKNGIQPYFPLAHVHQLEIVERLIRHGAYMGPLNISCGTYGGGGMGYNPFDWMEFIRRAPQGSNLCMWSMMKSAPVASSLFVLLGLHVRVGIEDNIWNSKRERITSVNQVKGVAELCERFGRKVATCEEARKMMKVGVEYNSVEETLQKAGLPPNREGDQPGFLIWETNGRRRLAHVMSDSHPMCYCMVPPPPIEPPDKDMGAISWIKGKRGKAGEEVTAGAAPEPTTEEKARRLGRH